MAKDNNIQDFLTDVADAIREKKGTTDAINPQDFSSEIASIQSGGNKYPTYPFADVQFIDYDGVLLHSYTWEEALALEELPPLPSHEGLICQGWNYTLEELKLQNGKCDIGATYITDDGATRICLSIDDLTIPYIDIQVKQSVANGVEFDWGDGSNAETFDSTSNYVIRHTYANKGKYVISIKVKNGNLTIGTGSVNANARNAFVLSGAMNWITDVFIGNNVIFNNQALNHIALNSITMPNGYQPKPYFLSYISNLKAIIFPRGLSKLPQRCFDNASIENAIISIPHSVTSSSSYFFYVTKNSTRLILPSNFATIGYAFIGRHGYRDLVIPKLVSIITADAFTFAQKMIKLVFLGDITSIASGAFDNLYMMKYLDLSNCSSVPTLSGTTFLHARKDYEILVPKALEEEWKNATNWVTYADHIVGV